MNKLNKQNRDRLIESKLTTVGEGLVCGGIEHKGKRTHEHEQQCVIADESGIRGINGNGKI